MQSSRKISIPPNTDWANPQDTGFSETVCPTAGRFRLWEHQSLIKSVYGKCLEPVCAACGLTRMELDILLFLANNPQFDTASDIIEKKRLTKSHVSLSIKSLELRGYLSREYQCGNRKTAHLHLLESASRAVHDGLLAQKRFADVLFLGFSEEDIKSAQQLFARITQNLENFSMEE